MKQAAMLCRLDRQMMQAFSQRTAQDLQQHKLFKMLLPVFNSFLELNVKKEIQKDQQVILRAAELVQADKMPIDSDVQGLLQDSREIDKNFLQQIDVYPVSISIDYASIEQIRRQRIQLLLRETHQIMAQWQDMPGLRKTLASLYAAQQFQTLVYDILNLYSQETEMLSHSVKLPALLMIASESIVHSVTVTMQTVARQLSQEITHQIYR